MGQQPTSHYIGLLVTFPLLLLGAARLLALGPPLPLLKRLRTRPQPLGGRRSRQALLDEQKRASMWSRQSSSREAAVAPWRQQARARLMTAVLT